MKKLLLSIFTLVSVAAFAQKDLQVTLRSPLTGAIITKNTPVTLTAEFKNVGMDSIKVEDTLRVQFLINNTPMNFTINGSQVSVFRLSHPTIYKDSSVFFSIPNVGFNPSAVDSADLCVVFDLSYGVRQDSNLVNNISCSTVLFAFPTGVQENAELIKSINAYPNPANTSFTITMKSTDATVEVMDITGKLVNTYPVTMGEAKMDVSNFSNGVYFYQIKTSANETVKSGKFTVSH
ncbi:MAG: T9SS type A sorting domain-containing protein [Bacteroidota bacterium]